MSQRRGDLTDKFIRSLQWEGKTFRKTDGGGRSLYIEVQRAGKYWRQKYSFGKPKWLYLGSYPDVTVKEARQRCDANRVLVRDGVDPAEAKRQMKHAQRHAVDSVFLKVANEWFDAKIKDKSESHRDRTRGYIEHQLSPLHRRPISNVLPSDITPILDKIAARGTLDTARRVLSVTRQIMEYAFHRQYFTGATLPTTGLSATLPVVKTVNRAAVTDPEQLGEVLRKLWTYRGTPQVEAALKLQPLLAVRPGELRNAEWSEFDWQAKRWLIPGERMKGGADFIVPLAPQVIEILEELRRFTGNRVHLFPSPRKPREPMSDGAVRTAMRKAGIPKEKASPHGFRASFRTLAEEKLGFDVAVIELQLAHAIRGPLGEAYGRAQFIAERSRLMNQWAAYINGLVEDKNGSGK